jgi:pimeloyl-ACP methyl ester carboxylesterase
MIRLYSRLPAMRHFPRSFFLLSMENSYNGLTREVTMDARTSAKLPQLEDKFVTVDGLKLRYIEKGQGPSVLFLHGASLGSSADAFADNIEQFAAQGFRAVAYDMPGFGLSDIPEKQTVPAQRNSIPQFIDAARLGKTALMAHSRSGGFAIELALADPSRYSHIVILGGGTLLPPQDEGQIARHQDAQRRADTQMAEKEPSPEDTRKLLQADTFNHALITDERLAVRHSRSVGRNFIAHVARQSGSGEGGAGAKKTEPAKPMWERLSEVAVPLLLIYGREDRAHAAARAELLKQRRPEMQIHVVPNCKHMVQWDAADEMLRLSVPFLKK